MQREQRCACRCTAAGAAGISVFGVVMKPNSHAKNAMLENGNIEIDSLALIHPITVLEVMRPPAMVSRTVPPPGVEISNVVELSLAP